MKKLQTLTIGLTKIGLLTALNSITICAFAQTTDNIKGVKTDNSYANQTEVSKAKNATDLQVLNDLQGDYGLGDVVRIVVNSPKPTIDPLANKAKVSSQAVNFQNPPIPKTEVVVVAQNTPSNTPAPVITSKSVVSQPTVPPQYKPANAPVLTATKAPSNTPAPVITSKSVVPQPTALPQYKPVNTPIVTTTSVPSNTPTPVITSKSVVSQPTGTPQYVIINNVVRTRIINDVPANQQTSTAQPASAPDVTNATSSVNSKLTASELSNNKVQRQFNVNETMPQQNVVSASERVANRSISASNRSERSVSHTRASSKSAGFSLKNVFSGLSNSSYKSAKHRKSGMRMKSKCYKF
jgi:hypothetical protein